MKKIFFPLILTIILTLSLGVAFAQAQATISISPNIPGAHSVSTAGPCGWIVNFYDFAMIIGGILAFGAVVWGGVLYATSAGNASKQGEGRSWIWSALIGLLLLGGAYLVLYTINPSLVQCSLPVLSGINLQNYGTTTGTGGVNTGGLTQDQAQADLAAAGISVVSSIPGCTDPTNAKCTSLVGMQQSTINELVALKGECGCNVTVTGGTEAGHAAGDISHANGDKADIALSTQTNDYIEQNFTPIGNRSSDGAPQYKDNSTGAVYALEQSNNHWDITVPPPKS